ncbi:hypothetical protein OG403_27515 [Kitasatospora sp. NBC_01266]|nr:hypothetical protein [Kitasatospora sp. NBC_01266]
MRAHKLATGARRFAAPQHVNDLLNADHPIRLGGEQAQQRALQPRRDDDRISPAPRRKGPEHIHAKFRAGIVVCGASTRLPVTVLAASRTIFPLSGVNERVELHGVHPERSGETVQRDGPRPRPPLQVTHGTLAHPGPRGKLRVSQPRADPQPPQPRPVPALTAACRCGTPHHAPVPSQNADADKDRPGSRLV